MDSLIPRGQTSVQSTVSEKVVVCLSEPEVDVTVTVEVTGVGAGVGVGVGEPPPPPQPGSSERAAARATIVTNRKVRAFLQKQQHTPNRAIATSGEYLDLNEAVNVCAVMVSVVVAAPPDGVTLDGLNVHDAPAANPEHAKVTGEWKPF